jgi:hypothetical protein
VIRPSSCKLLHSPIALTEQPHPEWRDDLALLTIEGSMLGETVFYHPATRTLITCDLVENFREPPHWLTCNYLRMGGVLGHVGWHTLLRLVYRNSKRARACVDRLLPGRSSKSYWRMASG